MRDLDTVTITPPPETRLQSWARFVASLVGVRPPPLRVRVRDEGLWLEQGDLGERRAWSGVAGVSHAPGQTTVYLREPFAEHVRFVVREQDLPPATWLHIDATIRRAGGRAREIGAIARA